MTGAIASEHHRNPWLQSCVKCWCKINATPKDYWVNHQIYNYTVHQAPVTCSLQNCRSFFCMYSVGNIQATLWSGGTSSKRRSNFGSSNDWPTEPLRPSLPILSNHLRLQERCCHTYSLLSGPGTRNLTNHGFRIRAGPLKWWNPESFWGNFHHFSPGPIKSSRKWITRILQKGWRGNDINSLEVFSDRLCPFTSASPEIH